MKPLRAICFEVPPEDSKVPSEDFDESGAGQWTLERIRQQLAENFSLGDTVSHRSTETVLDTFDWRLHRAGGCLTGVLEGRKRSLHWRDTHGQVVEVSVKALPGFSNELPVGSLKDQVAPLLSVRRLLHRVEIERRSRSVSVLDKERKTLARVLFEERSCREPGDPSWQALPHRVHVTPIRGYDDAQRRVCRLMVDTLHLHRRDFDDRREALALFGRRPGDYRSKVKIKIEATSSAADAARRIHRVLLGQIRINEDGVRRNLDSEFLHDFRVAIRRTRAMLSQVREVFPPAVTDHFKSEFAWLGRLSGPTRDLDVFLLQMEEYRAALPDVADDLRPLEQLLKHRYRLARRALTRGLDSPRYPRLLDEWEAFLKAKDVDTQGPVPTNAERSVVKVAGERIWKAYRKVRKRGAAIDEASPDEALHSLRIDCKKLRYLLEHFRSLYPAAEISSYIQRLKGLQDVLGAFNDYSVQGEQLRDLATDLQGGDAETTRALLATGRLMERLRRAQTSERHRFAGQFAGFAADETRRGIRRLCKEGVS